MDDDLGHAFDLSRVGSGLQGGLVVNQGRVGLGRLVCTGQGGQDDCGLHRGGLKIGRVGRNRRRGKLQRSQERGCGKNTSYFAKSTSGHSKASHGRKVAKSHAR
ncbi:hypothetical protein FHW94_002099 [Novosphingobium sp. SG720]|nr:hypothetical protein [Novosphingobium sp. SG720]